MKEATSLLQKIRSAALRRLLLDEARRWAFVACLPALILRVDCLFSGETSKITVVACSILFPCYAFFRTVLFCRRVPTLYQTARRLESGDAKAQGVLSAALEFESASENVAYDSSSLRTATINQARRWLENAFAEGRVRELRDLALNRIRDARRTRLAFLERIGALCAALLLVFVFWIKPNAGTPETIPTEQTTARELETTPKIEPNVDVQDVSTPDLTSATPGDELAFLRATLARSVALADSLTRELRDASFDSTLAFQLTREFDSELTSSSGLIASVGRLRASLAGLSQPDVAAILLTRRLREFDEYLSENRNVGAELTRLLATSTRSSSQDVRNEAFERALETLGRTTERLQVEERALNFLAVGWEYSRQFADLEQERAALLRGAVERLQTRPGAITDADASDLPTSEFSARLEIFAERWIALRGELEETARLLREPDAREFVAFVARFAEQTDSRAFLLGTDQAQVDLAKRFERPLASIRQIERNARAERWGKAATALSEASNARDMPGAEICEGEDFASTLAWRLAFGVFDGTNKEIKDETSTTKEFDDQTPRNEIEFDAVTVGKGNQEILDRMAQSEERASELTTYSGETQTNGTINASFDVASQSNKASEEGSAPDENYAGGAGERETRAPIENGTGAFSGELPDVAPQRLKAGRRWNPPLEYQEKERAFQSRLRKETRRNQQSRRNQRVSDAISK